MQHVYQRASFLVNPASSTDSRLLLQSFYVSNKQSMSSLGIISRGQAGGVNRQQPPSPRAAAAPPRPIAPSPPPASVNTVVIVAPPSAPPSRRRPHPVARCIALVWNGPAVAEFSTTMRRIFVISVALAYLCEFDAASGVLPFAVLTNVSTLLSFLTRADIVRCPLVIAASGIISIALALAYWIALPIVGVGGIERTSQPFRLHRQLMLYGVVPIDSFLYANGCRMYAAYAGAWYTLAIMVAYVVYALTAPEPPYPQLESVDAQTRAAIVVGASLAVPALHLAYVAFFRFVFGV